MSSVEREWNRLLCSAESDLGWEGSCARIAQPSTVDLDVERNLACAGTTCVPSTLPSLLCTGENPSGACFRSRSPLKVVTPEEFRRAVARVQGGRQTVGRETMRRLREEDAAQRQWLVDRGVVPAEVDPTRFPPSKSEIQRLEAEGEITTPSPFKDAYFVLRALGTGTDGTVYEVQDVETSEFLAAKVVRIDNEVEMFDDRVPLEARIMVSLETTPSVPRLEHMYVENKMTLCSKNIPPSFVLVMTMPPAPYCALHEARNLASFDGRKVFAGLIAALRGLDDNNVCHMDLHSLNVLVSTATNEVTLIDFGRAQYKDVPYEYTMIETYAGHMGSPPELRVAYRNYQREMASAPEYAKRSTAMRNRAELERVFDYDNQTLWTAAVMLFTAYFGRIFFQHPELDPSRSVRFPSTMPILAVSLLKRVFVPIQRRIKLREFFDHPFFDLTFNPRR